MLDAFAAQAIHYGLCGGGHGISGSDFERELWNVGQRGADFAQDTLGTLLERDAFRGGLDVGADAPAPRHAAPSEFSAQPVVALERGRDVTAGLFEGVGQA